MVYLIGRRTDDPSRTSEQAIPLLGDPASDLRIDLVRLEAREAGGPSEQQTGRGIVAVANGLVQVQIARGTPAIRAGEVLVADSDRIEGWRNIGQTEAVLFWIVSSPAGPTRSSRS
ncbi:MAG: hypothetical protein ACLPTJ_13090 [Solirubrobacteraceae bacterium]